MACQGCVVVGMFNAQENAWDAIDYGYIGPLLNTLVNKLLDYKWWWPCNLCFGLDENCLLCMHAWHDFSRFHPKILKHFCSFISVFWLLYVRHHTLESGIDEAPGINVNSICCIEAWIQPDICGCQQDFLLSEDEISWEHLKVYSRTILQIFERLSASRIYLKLFKKII